MLTFIIIGSIGVILLLGSMLLGEFLDFGDGAISGTSIGVGAVVFGATGAIATTNELPTWSIYLGSAVLAIAVVALVQALVTKLSASEDGIPPSLVGVQGVATTEITAARGEVSLDIDLERRLAWSDQLITEGTRVVVLEQAGSRVRVSPHWPTGTTPQGPPTATRWPQG